MAGSPRLEARLVGAAGGGRLEGRTPSLSNSPSPPGTVNGTERAPLATVEVLNPEHKFYIYKCWHGNIVLLYLILNAKWCLCTLIIS